MGPLFPGLCFQCSCQCHLDNSPSISSRDVSSVHSYLTLTPCLLMTRTALGYLRTTFSSLVSFIFSCYKNNFLVFFTQCSPDSLIIYLITIILVKADMFPKPPHIHLCCITWLAWGQMTTLTNRQWVMGQETPSSKPV